MIKKIDKYLDNGEVGTQSESGQDQRLDLMGLAGRKKKLSDSEEISSYLPQRDRSESCRFTRSIFGKLSKGREKGLGRMFGRSRSA